jgi:hypothetical protein
MIEATEKDKRQAPPRTRADRLLELIPAEGSILYRQLAATARRALLLTESEVGAVLAELCSARRAFAEGSSGFTFVHRALPCEAEHPVRPRPPAPLLRRSQEARR